MRDILLGFILSFILAAAAYIKKSLSTNGFIGAVLLGVSLYYFGGFYFWILMISFSFSSSVFTKFGESTKKVLDDINEKGGQRDYIQVIANGLLGFIFGFLYFVTHKEMFIIALATSFAASNADTWASELGVLSKMEPVSIINFKKIQKGVSGGVSVFGTISSLTGALFIALIFYVGYIIKFGLNSKLLSYAVIVSVSGFLGSIIDSLIGASFQAKYRCIVCGKTTEKKCHHGENTVLEEGISCLNNDAVNFVSGLSACLLAIIFYSFI